jgi:serine/threonine protein kinase/ligand-binding sensor domain-containing protein
MQQHIGRRLGAYQIVEQIGQGGMATVFKAYQPSVDRYVAIKILPSHLTEDESFVGRFTREARTLARLEHPHILPVYDYGEQEGTTYLVMRYVEAGTLKDLITQEGPMEPAKAARVMDQVGRALDHAHGQGVVHRDIKPSNILIDEQGNIFLTDFGIAKLVADTAQFTASGAIIGTPAYMSPEQSMGQPVDHRCDIYSLGVVLYELVTGRVPFEAETPLAVLLKHINDPLPLPRQIKPDLPEAVERAILKAMAKAPEDRFQSAGAMIDALAEAVAAPPAGKVAATTVAWQPDDSAPPAMDEATPRPAVDMATPAPARTPPAPADTTPPPALDSTPSQAESITPAPAPDSSTPLAAPDAALPRLETPAPARKPRRWLLLTGGALLLALMAVVVLLVVGNPGDGEPTPAATSTTEAQVQATTTAEGQPPAVSPPPTAGQGLPPAGWTNYNNGNFVLALARHDDTLWAGGDGGLVRWDLAEGTYSKLGQADGLASNRITDLLVDEAGVLWIATDAGINRDDGQTMTTYDEADGLDASWIQALFLDQAGGLWAGSRDGDRGLNYYDGQSWGPPPIPPLPLESPNVQVLDGNEQDGLVVGLEDQGLAHFDGETWRVLTSDDGLPGDGVLDALLTDDALWASFDLGVARLDLEMGVQQIVTHTNVYAIHQATDGQLWFGGEWRTIRFDPDSGDWQTFETSPGPLPAWLVTDIVEDENGLWFATYGGGAAFYDGSRWQTWATEEEVGGNRIEAIRQDRSGVLWFTHPGSGLSRYEPGSNTWQVFGQAQGALDWPAPPAIDGDGNLWLGDYGALLRYDGQGWQRLTAPELADVEVYDVENGPGGVQWLVTDGGLLRHDPAGEEWTPFTAADHPIVEDIWSLLAASDGSLWLGGEAGVVHYDGTAWRTPDASGTAPQMIDDLAEAPDGSLWMAADGQLVQLAADRWYSLAWPSDGWLDRVAVGPDGRVWAGGEGLGRYDPASGDWQLFTPADGLVHRLVEAIQVTPGGVVWIGTEAGISRYVPPE